MKYSVRSAGPSPPMLELSPAGSGLSPKLLASPGGFLWWYLDIVDDQGSGLVVIWSFGLPFIPGYADAARRGSPQQPQERPSLNVCVYDRGELDFYLLQEFEPGDVQWQQFAHGDHWTFGDSTIESVVENQRRRLDLDLNLDVPAMKGTTTVQMRAEGPGCHTDEQLHDPSRRQSSPLPEHDWAPLLCACEATAVVETQKRRVDISGRLYHDRNGGSRPLHEVGIDNWIWGRVAMDEGEFIYYVLDGVDGKSESHFFEIGTDGQVQECTDIVLRRPQNKTNFGGLKWWPSMTIERDGKKWLRITHRDVVDSGPFYLRSVLEAKDRTGRTFRGIAEVCEPERIDRSLHRPLVKMRVHHLDEANSMWLPLFSGPRRGRVTRLFRSLIAGE